MPFRLEENRPRGIDALVIRRLAEDMAADLPSGPGVHGFSSPHPIAGGGEARASDTDRLTFMVIRRGQEGVREIKRFRNELLAQAFLVELLTSGANREAVEVYQVSDLHIDVSFKPTVQFGGS